MKEIELSVRKEGERQKFIELYQKNGIRKGKCKSSEKFLEELKKENNGIALSEILTEQEILGCFNLKYGLKIYSYEAGSIYAFNKGIRKNYDKTPSLFSNSLFSDFLKQNGLITCRREWVEDTKTYKWIEDPRGKWTRDIICLKFDYGCKDYENEVKNIQQRKKEKSNEFEIFCKKQDDLISEYTKNEEIDEESLKRYLADIEEEKEEAKEKLNEIISFNDELLKFAEENKSNFPDRTIKPEGLREIFYTGKENTLIKYDNEEIYYKVLYRSAGKAKNGSIMALRYEPEKKEEDQLFGKAKKFLRMGLDFEDEESHIVEIAAYQSLVASTTVGKVQINPKNILIIKDVEIPFDRNTVSVIDLLEKNNLIKKEDCSDKDKKDKLINTLWDGQALIDTSVFDKSYFFSPEEELNGYILLREHFCKMAAFCTDIKQFFMDTFGDKYETTKVKDMFGEEHNVKDVELITTNNAMKWLKFCGIAEKEQLKAAKKEQLPAKKIEQLEKAVKEQQKKAYKNWCKKVSENGNIFGIVKTAHESKQGNYQRMSYQMVNALTNDPEKLEKIESCSLDYLDKLKQPDDDFIPDSDTNKRCKNLDENEFIKYLKRNANESNCYDVLVEICKANPNFLRSEFYRDTKYRLINSYLQELKSGRIIQNAENLVIVGSPYAMLLAAAGNDIEKKSELDTSFKLEDGAIQCFTERFDSEYLAEFRSPFNSRNNLGYLHNIPQPEVFKKYFSRFGRQIIAINMIGTDFQHRNNGSDQDSDSIFTTNQPEIVECAKEYYKNYPTIINDISSVSIKDDEYKREAKNLSNEEALLLRYVKVDNKLSNAKLEIGDASNKAQLCLTYAHSYNREASKYEDFVCVLSVLAQIAIDKAKRQFDIDSDKCIKQIEDMMNIDEYLYPEFWKTLDDRAKKRFANNKSKKDKEMQNDNLTCPMNFICNMKPINVKYRSKYSSLSMDKFYFNPNQDKSSHNISKKQRATEAIISKYSLGLLENNIDDSGDGEEERESFLLLRSDFDQMITDIRQKDLDTKELIPLLIDRAFCITPGQKRNKERRSSKTNKNKSILLKTLYKLDSETLIKCFSLGLSN